MASNQRDENGSANGPTVYVGVNLPHYLFQKLEQEAQRLMVSRSDVLRWALADRYRDQTSQGSQT